MYGDNYDPALPLVLLRLPYLDKHLPQQLVSAIGGISQVNTLDLHLTDLITRNVLSSTSLFTAIFILTNVSTLIAVIQMKSTSWLIHGVLRVALYYF